MVEREGKNAPARPQAGGTSAFDGLSEKLLVLILERCRDGELAAGPSTGEPATLPCYHFRLVCKEWAALGLKVLTKGTVHTSCPNRLKGPWKLCHHASPS
jgi:hypothetical protein